MTDTPFIFMTIKDASTYTGLSQFFLRNGCKDGTVPHVMCGSKYLINIPALLRKLDAEVETGRDD